MAENTSLFLAPCVNEQAQLHFQRTVLDGIDPSTYSPHTSRDYGHISIWGTREGNDRYWNQMEPGDFVLFYTESGLFTHAAKVIDVEENRELSGMLWTGYDTALTEDSPEEPWPLIIYLEAPFTIDLPSEELLVEYGGWKNTYPMNFLRFSEGGVAKIRAEHGSVRAYLDYNRRKGPDAPDDEVEEAKDELEEATASEPELTEERERVTTTKRRARSAAFREDVREHYSESCAVCGVRRETPSGVPEVEAAHIFPRSENGSNDVRNGIALCRLHHWAFDSGWISVDNDLQILVRDAPGRRGYEEFASLEGEELQLPDERRHQPHPKFLQEHREIHGFD